MESNIHDSSLNVYTFDNSQFGCHSTKLNRVSMTVIKQHTCTDQLPLLLHLSVANNLCMKGHLSDKHTMACKLFHCCNLAKE